jgi:hypothetical protein
MSFHFPRFFKMHHSKILSTVRAWAKLRSAHALFMLTYQDMLIMPEHFLTSKQTTFIAPVKLFYWRTLISFLNQQTNIFYSRQLCISIIANIRRRSGDCIGLFACQICHRIGRRRWVRLSNETKLNCSMNWKTLFSANVLARFGLKHPSRCLGLTLIK